MTGSASRTSLQHLLSSLLLLSFVASSLALFAFPPRAHADTTVIFLATTGSNTWTVPSDWNNSNNTIEVIGGGGRGAAGSNSSPRGGGDGAYSAETNVSLTHGGSVAYAVGAGGAGGPSGSNGSAGGDLLILPRSGRLRASFESTLTAAMLTSLTRQAPDGCWPLRTEYCRMMWLETLALRRSTAYA